MVWRGGGGGGPGRPMRNSALQPRSTQRPRLSIPQVLSRMQGEPLIWRVSWTSRVLPMAHQFLRPSVGRRNPLLWRAVARLCICGWGYCEGCPEKRGGDQEKLRCTCHLASFGTNDVAATGPEGSAAWQDEDFPVAVAFCIVWIWMEDENGRPLCRGRPLDVGVAGELENAGGFGIVLVELGDLDLFGEADLAEEPDAVVVDVELVPLEAVTCA